MDSEMVEYKAVKRCAPPSIYPTNSTLYTNDQIHIEMSWHDTENYNLDLGFKPLND